MKAIWKFLKGLGWWGVFLGAALVAFLICLFTRKTPSWFGTLLDRAKERRRTASSVKKEKKKMEAEREVERKKDADAVDARVDAWHDRVRKRREEAEAGSKPDKD